MIELFIEVPHSAFWSTTPKMIKGNYIDSDPRIQLIEADRIKGLCTIKVEMHDDMTAQKSYCVIQITYKDPEVEMLRKLSM